MGWLNSAQIIFHLKKILFHNINKSFSVFISYEVTYYRYLSKFSVLEIFTVTVTNITDFYLLQ